MRVLYLDSTDEVVLEVELAQGVWWGRGGGAWEQGVETLKTGEAIVRQVEMR
jgi:hypothetical protein